MPVEVSRIPDEPVIIATLRGQIVAEDTQYIFDRTQELRQNMPEHIYRITDVRDATSSFASIIEIIQQGAADRPSSTSDPTVTVVFVGKSQWSKLYIDALRQSEFGQVDIPLFNTLDEARAFIKNDMETHSA
jgi:hypothetical protein